MNINHVLNEVLVRLFRNINVIEERAICTGDYKDVTANDMHVIEAIDMEEARNIQTHVLPSRPSHPYGGCGARCG